MSEPILLEARDLKRHYDVRQGPFKPHATVKALDGVSFRVERGKTLAVVGESGCGKSTLAKLLTLIEQPTAGQLMLDGKDVSGASKQELAQLRQKIQIIFQNPYGSLNPRQKIGAILEEPLVINTSLTKAERKEKALAIMRKMTDNGHIDPDLFDVFVRQRVYQRYAERYLEPQQIDTVAQP